MQTQFVLSKEELITLRLVATTLEDAAAQTLTHAELEYLAERIRSVVGWRGDD